MRNFSFKIFTLILILINSCNLTNLNSKYPFKEISIYDKILNKKINSEIHFLDSILWFDKDKYLAYKYSDFKFNKNEIYIPNLDIENFNYYLCKDEKENWKILEIIDKNQKNTENPRRFYFSDKEFKNSKEKKRAIYLWNTIEILSDKNNWTEIHKKLKTAGIKIIYIQIPYILNLEKDNFWLKKRSKLFYNFLKFLMEEGFEIEFLDGWKGFALEPLHFRVINQIENLKYFWNKYFSQKIFPPLHLDIEPYLLRFYNNTNYQEIYNQYISLLKKIRERYPEIKLNLDIPFWLDNLKKGEEIFKNILKYSNGITIMAYRNKVSGSNGISGLTEVEVSIANNENKEIFIGIETMEIQSEKIYGIFKANNEIFPLYLNKTNFDNLFFISEKPSKYGVRIIEETPPDFISLYKKNWAEIENFANEILDHLIERVDGVSFHHWGSLKDKIK